MRTVAIRTVSNESSPTLPLISPQRKSMTEMGGGVCTVVWHKRRQEEGGGRDQRMQVAVTPAWVMQETTWWQMTYPHVNVVLPAQ